HFCRGAGSTRTPRTLPSMNARPARTREASPAPALRGLSGAPRCRGGDARPAPSLRAISGAPRVGDSIAQTSEYSIYGLTRDVDQALIRERRVGFAAVLFISATVIAVLDFLQWHASRTC